MSPMFVAFAVLAGQIQANPFADLCADLRVAVDAAYERPAFASFAAHPSRMRRFGPACALGGRGEYRRLTCEWHVAPVTNHWDQINDAITRCFPRALRMTEPEGSRLARFRFDVIAIHTATRDVGFRGGSYVSYSVMRLPVH